MGKIEKKAWGYFHEIGNTSTSDKYAIHCAQQKIVKYVVVMVSKTYLSSRVIDRQQY